MNFLNHCYVDTEVEMKEIFMLPFIWTLYENFLLDIDTVRKCWFVYLMVFCFETIQLFD